MSNLNKMIQALMYDVDIMKSTDFNYPKYEEIGVPHDVWIHNVSIAEQSLNSIVEHNPAAEQYPLMFIRREEKDEVGKVIRIHLDLYGKSKLVDYAMHMFSVNVTKYMFMNNIKSTKASEFLSGIPKEVLSQLSQDPDLKLDIVTFSDITSEEKMKEELDAHLKSKGISAANIKSVTIVGADDLKKATPNLSGPLNLENLLDGEDVTGNPLFIFPNPKPDEYN